MIIWKKTFKNRNNKKQVIINKAIALKDGF